MEYDKELERATIYVKNTRTFRPDDPYMGFSIR